MGWDYIPLVHVIGHACLRTLQFLRAPSVLLDSSALENAVGRTLVKTGGGWSTRLPLSWQHRLYAYALDRGGWDAWLNRLLVAPVLIFFRTCDGWERRWTNWLNGLATRPAASHTHHISPPGETP